MMSKNNVINKGNIKYVLYQDMVLGKGATSVVYKGQRYNDSKEVAIKVINDKTLPNQIENKYLDREYAYSLLIKQKQDKDEKDGVLNKNVLRILDVIDQSSNIIKTTKNKGVQTVYMQSNQYASEQKKEKYIITEICNKQTLFSYMSQKAFCFKQDEVIEIALQIINGISFLHNNGLMHRDLKPENIFLHEEIENYETRLIFKIGDFGLIKNFRNEQINRQQTMVGTINYMSPEIIQNINYSNLIDFWSFGCIVYELSKGEQKFWDATVQLVVEKILSFKAQNQFSGQITIERIISKCLDLIPDSRYKNTGEILRDLQQLKEQKDKPIEDQYFPQTYEPQDYLELVSSSQLIHLIESRIISSEKDQQSGQQINLEGVETGKDYQLGQNLDIRNVQTGHYLQQGQIQTEDKEKRSGEYQNDNNLNEKESKVNQQSNNQNINRGNGQNQQQMHYQNQGKSNLKLFFQNQNKPQNQCQLQKSKGNNSQLQGIQTDQIEQNSINIDKSSQNNVKQINFQMSSGITPKSNSSSNRYQCNPQHNIPQTFGQAEQQKPIKTTSFGSFYQDPKQNQINDKIQKPPIQNERKHFQFQQSNQSQQQTTQQLNLPNQQLNIQNIEKQSQQQLTQQVNNNNSNNIQLSNNENIQQSGERSNKHKESLIKQESQKFILDNQKEIRVKSIKKNKEYYQFNSSENRFQSNSNKIEKQLLYNQIYNQINQNKPFNGGKANMPSSNISENQSKQTQHINIQKYLEKFGNGSKQQ